MIHGGNCTHSDNHRKRLIGVQKTLSQRNGKKEHSRVHLYWSYTIRSAKEIWHQYWRALGNNVACLLEFKLTICCNLIEPHLAAKLKFWMSLQKTLNQVNRVQIALIVFRRNGRTWWVMIKEIDANNGAQQKRWVMTIHNLAAGTTAETWKLFGQHCIHNSAITQDKKETGSFVEWEQDSYWVAWNEKHCCER